jgi:hypothetical protein
LVAAAQTDPLTNLDLELTEFCSRYHITPTITEFQNDEDESDCVSNQSSDIEEESELRKFSRALRNAQIIALKKEKEKKNKRGKYSKRSKRTLECHRQACIKMVSKGYLPLDHYIGFKLNAQKHNDNDDAPTPESDNIIDACREESEEGSDEANIVMRDTCTHSSVNSVSDSEVEFEENLSLPVRSAQLRLRHHARMESEESTRDNNDNRVGDYARQ